MPSPTLQQRIDAAPARSVVDIPPGEHAGPLHVAKPLELRGHGPRSVILGAADGPAVRVASPGVTLRLLALVALQDQDVVLESSLPHQTALDQVSIVGETQGISAEALQGRAYWGRPVNLPATRPTGQFGRILALERIPWDPDGPFGDVAQGMLRECLALGGAVPFLVLGSLEANLGGSVEGGLHVHPLDGEGRPINMQVFLQGAPASRHLARAAAGGGEERKLTFIARPAGVTRLDASVNGLPHLAVALLTRDPTWQPPLGP